MKLRVFSISIFCASLVLSSASAIAGTEAEDKAFLKKIVDRFNYSCPEVKSYEPLEGTADELLILCGNLGEAQGDRDMGYVMYPAGNENHIRKIRIAPRTWGEWIADWF